MAITPRASICYKCVVQDTREQTPRLHHFISSSYTATTDSLFLYSASSYSSTSQGSEPRRTLTVHNVGWDPEGVLGAPVAGHISRRQSQKSLAQVESERLAEQSRRQRLREARVVPDTDPDLLTYFLATEASELRYEVARCRKRLTDGFLALLRSGQAELRAVKRVTEAELSRLAELETLETALRAEIDEYDRMAAEFLSRKDVLQNILLAKDKKEHLLDLAGKGQLDPPLLALLDHNIESAESADQGQTADFMKKIRAGVVKYMTF